MGDNPEDCPIKEQHDESSYWNELERDEIKKAAIMLSSKRGSYQGQFGLKAKNYVRGNLHVSINLDSSKSSDLVKTILQNCNIMPKNVVKNDVGYRSTSAL